MSATSSGVASKDSVPRIDSTRSRPFVTDTRNPDRSHPLALFAGASQLPAAGKEDLAALARRANEAPELVAGDAGLEADDLDYVNAHGTSTPMGDEIELTAVERLLGNRAGGATMSSTKSSTGHLLGAAGAIEAIFSILAIRDQVAPPTLNLEDPSVQTSIDLAPLVKREREINVALSNSFGFGGTNASIIFGQPPEA